MENEVLKLILSVEDKSVIKATQEAKRLEKEIKALVATEKVLGKEHEIVKQKTIEIKRKLQDYANISSQKAVPTLKKLIQAERTLSLEVDKNTAALTRNTKATKLAADASNQYGTYSITAGKKLNTFNMKVQQTGYQLQDFFVQLQSGTSFFTAFGQQGSQLAGIFGPAGAVFGAVIAIGSAIAAIGYNALTASEEVKEFGEEFGEAKTYLDAFKDSLDLLAQENGELEETFGNYTSYIRNLEEAALSASESLSRIELGESVSALSKKLDDGLLNGFTPLGKLLFGEKGGALKDLGLQESGLTERDILNLKVNVETGAFEDAAQQVEFILDKINRSQSDLTAEGLKYQLSYIELGKELAKHLALTNGTAQAAKDAAEAQKQNAKDAKTYAAGEAAMLKILKKKAEDRNNAEITFLKIMQASMNERQKGLDAEQKINDLVDKRRNSMLVQGDLLKHEVFLRTAYKDETYIQERLEQKKLDLYIKQADLNETQAARLRAALNYLVDQKKALKDLNEQESIRLHLQNLQVKAIEESPAGQALKKYGARGTRSDKDPIFGTGPREGKSIYDEPPKAPKAPKDALASLIQNLELQLGLLDVEEDRASVLKALGEDRSKYTQEEIQQAIDLTEKIRLQTEALEQQKQVSGAIADSFNTAAMSIVTDIDLLNDSFEDFGYKTEMIFKKMAAQIIQDLYQIYVVKQITGFISGAIGGYLGQPSNATAMSNQEASFGYDGGGYTGSGPRSGGLDGKGGFMAMLHPRETVVDHTKGQSTGGDNVVINQSFSFAANGDESVRKIIAQEAPKISKMTEQSILDSRRRGGRMKAVFG